MTDQSAPKPLFTVCCLFYGDYPRLVERLLASLATTLPPHCYELRIGTNDVCGEGLSMLNHMIKQWWPTRPRLKIDGDEPYHKYPMMRRLFYALPITTPYVMWFDDDSFIKPSGHHATNAWHERVAKAMEHYEMIGAPYSKRLEGNQLGYIQDQPWYTGKTHRRNASIDFVTGGWWTIHTSALLRHDWPPVELEHNGGDVLLGVLCKEQGYRMGRFTQDLGINCNDSGECSTAPRRGFSQKPLGANYSPNVPVTPPLRRNWLDMLDGKQ